MTKPKNPSQLKGANSKLTREDVLHIREAHARGTQSVRELAQFYGLAAETIRRAIRGETWNHLRETARKTEAELETDAASSLARLNELLAAEKARLVAGDNMVAELAASDDRMKPGGVYDFVGKKAPKNPLDE